MRRVLVTALVMGLLLYIGVGVLIFGVASWHVPFVFLVIVLASLILCGRFLAWDFQFIKHLPRVKRTLIASVMMGFTTGMALFDILTWATLSYRIQWNILCLFAVVALAYLYMVYRWGIIVRKVQEAGNNL